MPFRILQHGIRYEVYHEMEWIDSGGVDNRRRKNYENRQNYMKCSAALYCKTLYKGKIYACARTVGLHDLGYVNGNNSYLDIYDIDDIRKKIKRFWLKDYDVSCNYCDYADSWRKIEAAEQIEN